MELVLVLVLLAGLALLLPIHLAVAFRWEDGQPKPWSLRVGIWGFPLLRLPSAPRRSVPSTSDAPREKGLPPWLDTLISWTSRQWRRQREKERAGKSRPGTLRLVARLARHLILGPTRKVRLDLGGIDPAVLAGIHGAFLSISPLLPGDDLFLLRPDWTAFRPRVRFLWSYRASLARLVGTALPILREHRRRATSASSLTASAPS